jgi:hypothetical protein
MQLKRVLEIGLFFYAKVRRYACMMQRRAMLSMNCDKTDMKKIFSWENDDDKISLDWRLSICVELLDTMEIRKLHRSC